KGLPGASKDTSAKNHLAGHFQNHHPPFSHPISWDQKLPPRLTRKITPSKLFAWPVGFFHPAETGLAARCGRRCGPGQGGPRVGPATSRGSVLHREPDGARGAGG